MSARRFLAVIMATLCMLLASMPGIAAAQAEDAESSEWVTFLLLCNEGMLNDGGNVGNTVMIVSMHPIEKRINLLTLLWDTFIEYPGYETMQVLDRPFRVNGPEETMRIVKQNFNLNLTSYLSINFTNLASLIDVYGGITADVTRAERNALNGMVGSKVGRAEEELANLELDTSEISEVFNAQTLEEYGPSTHLSGMQAVGYGWLQYDSVANCCLREVEVISQLFTQMYNHVNNNVVLYNEKRPLAASELERRSINTDNFSEEDRDFLYELLSPLFDKSANNLTRDQIDSILQTILKTAELDGPLFENVKPGLLPFEWNKPKTSIGGIEGVQIDFDLNREALVAFLYDEGGKTGLDTISQDEEWTK